MSNGVRQFALAARLAQKPFLFCGCWWLSLEDTRRAKRVFRLTRAVIKFWGEQRRHPT